MAEDRISDLKSSNSIFSILNIPYSSTSSLNTVDLHFPNARASTSFVWIIYIHGGAFRDPLQDSRTIDSTLPLLFDTTSSYPFYGIASLNYRLSPYASHPTHPSLSYDLSRNAKWPDHLDDVVAGIRWVLGNGASHDPRPAEEKSQHYVRRYVLAGHSVGGTMALKLAAAENLPFPYPMAVLSLCGIYDFTALRDAHPSHRQLYDDFTTGAFGPEEEGGWDRGSTRKGRFEKTKIVILAHSKTDTLVEWDQTNAMKESLDAMPVGSRAVIMEVQGDHKEIYENGVEVAKAIKAMIGLIEEVDQD